MALIPLVMINDTIKKYENKEKLKIYVETLAGKKITGRGESFTMNLKKNYKVQRCRKKKP